MAGGQDLLGMLKDYIATPDTVIDLKRISALKGLEYDPSHGLRIGALTTLSEIAENADVRIHFPALSDAAGSVASPQIRNVATIGGNLCQRPRCWYFRNEHIRCLKKGGDRCFAAGDDAENKYHAILGVGPCHFVHPSDVAPALVCLGASIVAVGSDGAKRVIPAESFFPVPADSLYQETVLHPGEIVTEVRVPASAHAAQSVYLKFREKASFDWALASVAMAAHVQAGAVRELRVVLGGVATIPWRAKSTEDALVGHALDNEAMVAKAAEAATDGAEPLAQNAYKIKLVQAVIRRAAKALASGDRSTWKGGTAQWIA
jgi:xanthine dehydrogenase YagS FAD-binding subunit